MCDSSHLHLWKSIASSCHARVFKANYFKSQINCPLIKYNRSLSIHVILSHFLVLNSQDSAHISDYSSCVSVVSLKFIISWNKEKNEIKFILNNMVFINGCFLILHIFTLTPHLKAHVLISNFTSSRLKKTMKESVLFF